MANEPELKKYYANIRAHEEEMARYRARLAGPLARKRPRASRLNHVWFGIAVTAAIILAFLLLPARKTIFPQKRLVEIEALVDSGDTGELSQLALQQMNTAQGTERLNAMMVLCLTQPAGEAVRVAAAGALADPRPRFRSFYLEYLLDFADEYQLNTALIEERMDSETDKECLYLYGRLLKLAPIS